MCTRTVLSAQNLTLVSYILPRLHNPHTASILCEQSWCRCSALGVQVGATMEAAPLSRVVGCIMQGPEHSELSRDFTFIDDIVEAIMAALRASPASIAGKAHYKVRHPAHIPPRRGGRGREGGT